MEDKYNALLKRLAAKANKSIFSQSEIRKLTGSITKVLKEDKNEKI